MEKQKKVVDASVIAKLFLNERGKEAALRLKSEHLTDQITLIVPELLFLEVLNTFRYKKKELFPLEKINAALFDLQFAVEKLNFDLLEKTIENSIKYNITIYDSLYVSIANFHGCPLITADSSLYKIPNVVPLERV